MSRFVVVVLTAVVMLTSVASAFDGQRKGVVLGGGVGAFPLVHWSLDESEMDETVQALGFRAVVGYAWSNSDMIVGDIAMLGYRSSELDHTIFIEYPESLLWYHYFRPSGSSIFTAVGGGRMYVASDIYSAHGDGWHGVLGLGYELTTTVQVGFYYVGGYTESRDGYRMGHSIVGLQATVMAY